MRSNTLLEKARNACNRCYEKAWKKAKRRGNVSLKRIAKGSPAIMDAKKRTLEVLEEMIRGTEGLGKVLIGCCGKDACKKCDYQVPYVSKRIELYDSRRR